MKLAVSNIAWQEHENEAVANIMHDFGIGGLEVAPTKVFPKPISANESEIVLYRKFWEDRGIIIVALQSLLFGRPDLTIFENKIKREETFDYLLAMLRLGNKLGAKVLVFGSPKNRQVDKLSIEEIEDISLPFFYRLGELAVDHGMIFCIEPNPIEYGCDFINTSDEGLALVRKVNSTGFGLHLDSGTMTLNNESIIDTIKLCTRFIEHLHISEPYLKPFGDGVVKHELISQMLKEHKYKNWVSFEMLNKSDLSSKELLINAISNFNRIYGDP